MCGDNLKYSTKFLSNFLGPKRESKNLRAQADAHDTHVGIKVSTLPGGPKPCPSQVAGPRSKVCRSPASAVPLSTHTAIP